jgi:hypothetical protein
MNNTKKLIAIQVVGGFSSFCGEFCSKSRFQDRDVEIFPNFVFTTTGVLNPTLKHPPFHVLNEI